MSESQQPTARVKLVRSDNAKVNGITIEIEGQSSELTSLVNQAFVEFERAIDKMHKHDPQSQAK